MSASGTWVEIVLLAMLAGFIGLRLLFYPALAFLKLYLGKRYFLNGWAGFFAARTQAFYAFLKYAKLLEADRRKQAQPFE